MGTYMGIDELDRTDEAYFDTDRASQLHTFDSRLLGEPLTVLPTREPLVYDASASATAVMRRMQSEHRGCVLITEDGTPRSRLTGIFTERDVLLRIIDRGKNPANVLTCVVTGQLLASLVIDHYGWLGFPVHPISLLRVFGVLFLFAGVIIIKIF